MLTSSLAVYCIKSIRSHTENNLMKLSENFTWYKEHVDTIRPQKNIANPLENEVMMSPLIIVLFFHLLLSLHFELHGIDKRLDNFHAVVVAHSTLDLKNWEWKWKMKACKKKKNKNRKNVVGTKNCFDIFLHWFVWIWLNYVLFVWTSLFLLWFCCCCCCCWSVLTQ